MKKTKGKAPTTERFLENEGKMLAGLTIIAILIAVASLLLGHDGPVYNFVYNYLDALM